MHNIFIIAGEASGDLHGSNLVKELKLISPAVTLQGWGGELMQQQGVTILKHYKELAFMGFTEVIANLGTILHNFKLCKQQITTCKPSAIIFIDYPGFNLRMAKWAKQQGYTTIYYISPQIWAWKANRIHTIKKYVDHMIVILPFEKAYYNTCNYAVSYVGHPLIKVIANYKITNPNTNTKQVIALLPGSRKQEIKSKLPIMLSVAALFPSYKFVIAKAPGIDEALYTQYITPYANVTLTHNGTYSILNHAVAAIVTSGTATLETALFKVPQVVCYRGSAISYAIAKRLIKIKYISLVNLIMDKSIVKELIQHECNTHNLHRELNTLLTSHNYTMLSDYDALYTLLQAGGDASAHAATLVQAAITNS